MRSFATIALVALSLASGCNPADPVAADLCPNATECGGACVDTSNDAEHCDAPSRTCPHRRTHLDSKPGVMLASSIVGLQASVPNSYDENIGVYRRFSPSF
jgi:hypothetical protein